ncbi:MAG TPA: hypothetical protein VM598_01135, partial [Bdellovibrionota bacterium]|nr:hypothetical protein [Bdellovibrionota bacterium]
MYVVLSRVAVLTAIFFSTVASTTAWSEDQKRPDSFDLLGYFPTTDTSGRIRPFQFRVSLLSGPVTYFSKNIASDAEITANVQQLGFRIEGDHWFQIGSGNRRPIGVLADLQLVNVSELQGIQGDPISYTSGSL